MYCWIYVNRFAVFVKFIRVHILDLMDYHVKASFIINVMTVLIQKGALEIGWTVNGSSLGPGIRPIFKSVLAHYHRSGSENAGGYTRL
jgi:hypothetical protein